MFQMFASNFRLTNISAKCLKLPLGISFERSFFTEKELGVEDLRQNQLKVFSRIEKQNEEINLHKLNLIQSFPNLPEHQKAEKLYDYLLLMDSTDNNDLNMLKSILVRHKNDIVAASATTNDNNNVQNGIKFHVGTAIMRTFFLLNFPEAAIEFYKDEQIKSLFDEMDAYKVLLTLLHNNKRYEGIFQLYKEIRADQELHNKLPHASINVLAFSACYHLNTPEHYQYAKDLYPHVRHIKAFKRRTKYLLAGLALKQNDPMFALQLLDPKEYQIGARFIRLIAFTQCKSFDCALDVLNQTIDVYKQGKMINVPYYGKQVLADLREAITKSGTSEQLAKFDEILEELKKMRLLNEKTLDELLNAKFPTKYVKTKAEQYFSDRYKENTATISIDQSNQMNNM